MNKAKLCNILFKVLELLYNQSYSEEEFERIIKKERENKEDNIVFAETNFLYNIFKTFPWYSLFPLLSQFQEQMQKNSNNSFVNLHKNLLLSLLEDLDFFIKERMKTIFYENIEILFRKYYSSKEKMSILEACTFLKENKSNIEYITSLNMAESFKEEDNQQAFINTQTSEETQREILSKRNTLKKNKILNSTIKILENYLNLDELNDFYDLVSESLKIIGVIKEETQEETESFYLTLLQDIYDSVTKKWKSNKEQPLLKLLNQK